MPRRQSSGKLFQLPCPAFNKESSDSVIGIKVQFRSSPGTQISGCSHDNLLTLSNLKGDRRNTHLTFEARSLHLQSTESLSLSQP